MADLKAVSMGVGVPGVEIAIWYNEVNDKIGAVTWEIAEPGIACRVRIWDTNVSEVTPVIDRTEGQGSGAESILGNYRMVEVTEGGETFMDLPPNIVYKFEIRSL